MSRSKHTEEAMTQAKKDIADRLSETLRSVLEEDKAYLEQRTDQIIQSCRPEEAEWFRQFAERAKKNMQQITEDGIRQIRELADRSL